MRKVAIIVFLLLGIAVAGCRNAYERRVLKDNSPLVETQYNLLQIESQKFLTADSQSGFMEAVNAYLKKGDGNLAIEKASKMKVLDPLLTNGDHTKAIVLTFDRGVDMAGKRVDYIRFISAKYADGKWQFGFKKGHSFSFYYADEDMPLLTEDELAKQAIRNLMLMGYYKGDSLYSEKLFESDWYVL